MAREPLANVRRARQEADRQLASVHKEGVIARLRQVHPAIVIGGAAVAGFLIAKLLTRPRAERAVRVMSGYAPLAAAAAYVQRRMWAGVFDAVRGWWRGRVRTESPASPAAEQPHPAAGADGA